MSRAREYRVVRNELKGTWNVCFNSASTGKPTSRMLGRLAEMTEVAASKKAAELVRNQQPSSDSLKVREIVKKFREERMPERFSTKRGYECWIRNHILPKWGDHPITELTAQPVALWLKTLNLSAKSQVHIRGVIARFWKFAMYAEIVPREVNPMDFLEISGASKSRTRKPRSLSVEEFEKFLEKMTEEPYRTMTLICISLGLRISETLGLKWGDVDWLESTLQVSRGIVMQHEGNTKTDESESKLPIDPGLLQVLNTWRQATQFPSNEDWMFASPVQLGRLPWSYPHVWRKVMEAARSAGIGKLSPHDLRHSYRSWLGDSGAAPEMQKLLMRHSDIRTTMNLYGKRCRVTAEMRQAHSKVARMAVN